MARALFLLALVAALGQVPRSVDFSDYYLRAREARVGGYTRVPYPQGTAVWGDFFQSPAVVVGLAPLTHLPLGWAKGAWAALNVVGIAYLLRVWVPSVPSLGHVFFLLCLFAHGLSDVFLSGNINFPLLVLCVAGWRGLGGTHRFQRGLGGLGLALAILIKLQPAAFVLWFAWKRQWHRVGWTVLGLGAWAALTLGVLSPAGALAWWKGWWGALALYPVAASPATLSYQSPPAFFFRWLLSAGVEVGVATTAMGALSMGLGLFLGGLALLRDRQGESILPIGLASFFLMGPFSWALTALFLFPAVVEQTRHRIGPWFWSLALIHALIPKALWPLALWERMAWFGLPGLCLVAVGLGSLLKGVRWSGLPLGRPISTGFVQ